MKFVKGSLKLTPPVEPKSDAERERLLARNILLSRLSGLILIIGGLGQVLSSQSYLRPPLPIVTFVTATFYLCFIICLFYALRLSKYALAPKDEFERVTGWSAKASGYDFMRTAVIILVLVSGSLGSVSLGSLMFGALGISQLIVAYKLKHGNA